MITNTYKGMCKESELPTTGNASGDYYVITDFDESQPGKTRQARYNASRVGWDLLIDPVRTYYSYPQPTGEFYSINSVSYVIWRVIFELDWTPTSTDEQAKDTSEGISNVQEVIHIHGVYSAAYNDSGTETNITSPLMSYRLFLLMKTSYPNDNYCSARYEGGNVHIFGWNGTGNLTNMHATVTCDFARENVPVAAGE
jgi:hypothetical protein